MPAIAVNRVRRQNGKIFITFGKVEREFNDLQHLRDWVKGNLPDLSTENIHALVLKELMQSVTKATDLDTINNLLVDITLPDSKKQ